MEKVMNEKIIMNYEVVELLHKSSSWGNIVFKVKPQNKEKLYEIGLQTVDNKAVEKMAVIESEKHPSSGRKNGCAGVRNVAPSKVTEKNKRNKYHEVNYCYGEGESL